MTYAVGDRVRLNDTGWVEYLERWRCTKSHLLPPSLRRLAARHPKACPVRWTRRSVLCATPPRRGRHRWRDVYGSNRRRADRVGHCCRGCAVAFQVGDRVKINAAGWEHYEEFWCEPGEDFPRGDTYVVTDARELGPIRVISQIGALVGRFDAEHLEPADAQPDVLDRFAELAKDPAMIPVLEAAAAMLASAQDTRRAFAAERKFRELLEKYQRDGAQC